MEDEGLKTELDLASYHGLVVPSKLTNFELFNQSMNYEPPNGDIVIASYPKSGTTWMQYIVWELIHNQGPVIKDQPQIHEMWSNISLQLECHGVDMINSFAPPRIIKTHNPVTHLNYSSKCKYIYVIRNPWDVCISLYNNLIEAPQVFGSIGSTERMINQFLNGQVPWGDYFNHVTSWLHLNKDDAMVQVADRRSLRPGSNLLIVSYEELTSDLKSWIIKIATFLNDDHPGVLARAEERLEDIATRTSFANMKKLKFIVPDKFGHGDAGRGRREEGVHEQQFFKNGRVNYGYEYFTEDQKERMLNKIKSKFQDFQEIIDLWTNYGVPLTVS